MCIAGIHRYLIDTFLSGKLAIERSLNRVSVVLGLVKSLETGGERGCAHRGGWWRDIC